MSTRTWTDPDTLGDIHLMEGTTRLATVKPSGLWRTHLGESDDEYGCSKDGETAKIEATAAVDSVVLLRVRGRR